MKYEQEARERQGMLDEIDNLKKQLLAIEADFAKCARGWSPCFSCANDSTCDCVNDDECCFKWQPHN